MSFREKYFSDYRAETTLHPNGRGYKVEYVYCGDWYCWDLAKPDFLRFKGAMLLLCGAELVVYAICALQYAPANTSPIVAAGGSLAIIAQIFQWIGLVQLCLSRRKVKDRDCHEIWAKLRGNSCLCAALLAVSACGCLLRQGWLLAAGYAMDALLAYAMYRKIKGLTFSLLPGDGSTFTED